MAVAKRSSSFIILPHLLEHLLVRCRGCGGFAFRAQVAMAGCGACDYHNAFCPKCGGEDSARRGILIHQAWWAKRPKDDRGVHANIRADYLKLRRKGR